MANLINIKKEPLIPNQSAVVRLEEMLVQAKSGELRSMVIVADYHGDSVSSIFSDILENRMRIIGELEQVKWHLMDPSRLL